jgi:hypothetical protein
MIKDFTPARTSLSSGVVVKQHILERNRVRPAQVTSSNELLEGLVKPFSRGYDTGSGDTGQYEYISGSSIYRFSGGTGGTFEQFNGTEFYPTTVNNIYNVTQSWDESFPSVLGTVIYDRDDQREFYNGEFSGSDPYVKLQRGLGDGGDPCAAFLKINPNEFYVYDLEFYGGPDNDYTITTAPLPTPTPTPTSTLTPTPTVTPTPTPSSTPSPLFTIYIKNDIPVVLDGGTGIFSIGGVNIKDSPGFTGASAESSVAWVSGPEQQGATIYVSSTPFAGNDLLYVVSGSNFNTSNTPYDWAVLQINNSGIVDTVYNSNGDPI